MSIWMKNKLVTIIIAVVAVFTVAGAGAVMAAQSHNPSSSPRTSDGAAQAGKGFEAQGVIQQVMFDQGTTQSGSLVFLPTGKQTTVTVTFTTATEIHTGTASGSSQQTALQAGMMVKIEGTVQADGSVLAREINANAGDANNDDGNNDNDQEDQHLVGVIQSVDTNAQTFEFLPDGQTTTMTIAYDANTHIEDEHDDDHGGAALVAGAHVQVEVITRADGSLYAKEIGPVNDNQGTGDNGDDHGGNSGPGGGDNGGSGSGDDNSGSGDGGSDN